MKTFKGSTTSNEDTINIPDLLKVLDVIITPVILADLDNVHFYHNRSYEERIGYSIEEVSDIYIWASKAYPDETYRRDTMKSWDQKQQLAKKDKLSYINLVARVCCKDNTYKWFDIHEHFLGKIRVITFLDVDELQLKVHDLLDMVHFKRSMLSSLAHDIRGPLASLQNYLKYDEQMKLSGEQWQTLFSTMTNHINCMFNLIDATVIHECNEMQYPPFSLQKIQLNPFLNKIIRYFENEIKRKDLIIQRNFEEDDFILYDTFILEIMLRNIVVNAVKFSPEGGKITIRFEKDDLESKLSIQDSGTGLTPQQIAMLMNNQSARGERDEIKYGFGLGLVIAKETLERYKGKLLIESKPKNGSCFTIIIPNSNLTSTFFS